MPERWIMDEGGIPRPPSRRNRTRDERVFGRAPWEILHIPARPRRERQRQPIEFDGIHRHWCTFEIYGTRCNYGESKRLLKIRPTAENILEILRDKIPTDIRRLTFIYWQRGHIFFSRCQICDTIFESGRREDLCSECRRTHIQCVWCVEYCHIDDAHYDQHDRALCRNCYRRGAGVCEDCGYWQENLDEDGLCEECAHSRHRAIHDHDYRPNFNFLPASHPASLYLGVELETDNYPSGKREQCGEKLVDLDEDGCLFYLKDDGSLDCGFEVVSHPATLEYHKTQFPWEKIIEVVKEYGGKSHDATSCGLHIHFNSNFFGDPVDGDENNLHATKLTYIFEKFWEQIKVFSRRSGSDIEHWAGRYVGLSHYNIERRRQDYEGKVDGVEDKDIEIIKKAKGGDFDRYRAVNFCNHHTIEIRVFKGTLKLKTLYASLEFVDFLVNLVKKHNTPYLRKLTWENLVRQAVTDKQYEYLPDYLRERRLAVVRDNS